MTRAAAVVILLPSLALAQLSRDDQIAAQREVINLRAQLAQAQTNVKTLGEAYSTAYVESQGKDQTIKNRESERDEEKRLRIEAENRKGDFAAYAVVSAGGAVFLAALFVTFFGGLLGVRTTAFQHMGLGLGIIFVGGAMLRYGGIMYAVGGGVAVLLIAYALIAGYRAQAKERTAKRDLAASIGALVKAGRLSKKSHDIVMAVLDPTAAAALRQEIPQVEADLLPATVAPAP